MFYQWNCFNIYKHIYFVKLYMHFFILYTPTIFTYLHTYVHICVCSLFHISNKFFKVCSWKPSSLLISTSAHTNVLEQLCYAASNIHAPESRRSVYMQLYIHTCIYEYMYVHTCNANTLWEWVYHSNNFDSTLTMGHSYTHTYRTYIDIHVHT